MTKGKNWHKYLVNQYIFWAVPDDSYTIIVFKVGKNRPLMALTKIIVHILENEAPRQYLLYLSLL